MSEERRKMNKQCTGTVPKTKCRNNASCSNERDSPQSWTNNLAVDFHRLNVSDFVRNSRRNLPVHSNYCAMNSTLEDQRHLNQTMNGSMTPNTSSSTSRRNSSGTVPKCDNVPKYPDKKQIEDKLSQIREYLQITTSLMSSMKNTDEQSVDADESRNLAQMICDLRDSEAKLVEVLEKYDDDDDEENIEQNEQIVSNGQDNYSESAGPRPHRNDLEDKIDHTNREMELLRDQQMTLLTLQQKAENKLKDARHIQDKLLMAQYGNELNSATNLRDKNFTSMQDFDAAIREIDERSKRLNERGPNSNLQDKLLAEVDSLQNQIITLHNANEDRSQLIHVLDNRDTALRAQHQELQGKLHELHNKKLQVDQLVHQLQNMDEAAEDDDVGVQVRRIMTMKDQLSKLKDMLEIVKTTENSMQNSSSQEEQDLACDICTKAENFLQKDGEKSQAPSQQHREINVRCDNNNENRRKQINKNGDRQCGFGGARPKSASNANNKMALQAELESKKRELEEIMGKHKASTSNLNHDVIGTDNKSEFSCSSNAFFDGAPGWAPIMSEHNRFDSSERYSSDDGPEDGNEYSEHNQTFSLPVLNYPRAKSDQAPDYIQLHETDRLSSIARTPERNVRGNSISARQRSRSNSDQTNKNQVQKQLELIRSVCDSMLLDQSQGSNVQLRNNLTPSPLYSEPRRFASPNPHPMNAIVNPIMEPVNNDGWLATNNLQTQAFMLNTLNQCCQMLWLQQRELINLRQTVSQLQDRVENPHFDSHLASPMQNPVESRNRSNQKANQVSAACSMPNLNQYNMNIPSVNLDPTYHNNMQAARLLDPCLNNASLATGDHINNAVLHGVNANINQMHQGQIWNGQALNNQVAPGNRANNYWDNFRSYSRQNLLSTKSNEGIIQNMVGLERANNLLDRSGSGSNPFALIQLSKSNSDQTGSAGASQENTPQRRAHFSLRNSDVNRNNAATIQPPDVLNVNHNVNKSRNESSTESGQTGQRNNENDPNLCCHHLNNAFAYNETSSNNSNVSEDLIFKECISETARRRNEWHEEQNEEAHTNRSKLFEELRENVYKEVVTLISANEARPHFLIQLFRDLQMISSDPLRLKILQSIQTIITHSLVSANQINRQVLLDVQQNDQMLSDNFSLQSTVWPKAAKNPASTSRSSLHTDLMQSSIKEIVPYLNDHEEDIINHQFLSNLKQVLLESETFQDTVRDTVFKKHFSNVLDEVLTQYHGKKVQEVKMHIIQTVNDLLRGELSFIQLIQDTCPENCADINEIMPGHMGQSQALFEPPLNGQTETNGGQIQNGDLAEADQGRVEDEDVEEEGAVGGFWDLQLETPLVNPEEVEISVGEFQNSAESQTQYIKQGLDQVPTRLPTKSRSNTPSKDRSTSSRSDNQDQF